MIYTQFAPLNPVNTRKAMQFYTTKLEKKKQNVTAIIKTSTRFPAHRRPGPSF